jgi:predicted metal-dependent enzyme (double-stranded beta helix superfamily)
MPAVKYSLEEFIQDMDSLLAKGADRQRIFDEGSAYLERLIRNPEAIPEEYRRPLGRGPRARHGSYKLHQGDNGLSVSSVIWGPGDHIGPHDHHTWGMIGVMENVLAETRFRRMDDRTDTEYAVLEKDRVALSKRGEVSLLIPDVDEIHAIDNESDRPTVEIHVYGNSLEGLQRCKFDLSTGRVYSYVSGKANNE